jgi:hypothetical protein
VPGLLLALGLLSGRLTAQDEVQISIQPAVLQIRMEEGYRAQRPFRIGNFNPQAVPIHALRASDPRISLRLSFEDRDLTVTEKPLDESLPPQGRAKLWVTVDGSGLEQGQHRFEVHLLPVADEPPLILPIEVDVREADREERDRTREDRGRREPIEPVEGPPPRLLFDRYVEDLGEPWSGRCCAPPSSSATKARDRSTSAASGPTAPAPWRGWWWTASRSRSAS